MTETGGGFGAKAEVYEAVPLKEEKFNWWWLVLAAAFLAFGLIYTYGFPHINIHLPVSKSCPKLSDDANLDAMLSDMSCQAGIGSEALKAVILFFIPITGFYFVWARVRSLFN